MIRRFQPIDQKSGEIINYLMSYSNLPESDSDKMKIRLCIEEAVVNITQYAYKQGQEGWLEASIDLVGNFLVVKLKDAGIRFNPLETDDPDITLSAEERSIGGLGIFLCKTLMDDIQYFYEDNCNTLIMKKIVKTQNS